LGKKLKITWKRSTIGCPKTQRAIIASLGLRKLNQSVVREDTPTVRGMIARVGHLLEVEDID